MALTEVRNVIDITADNMAYLLTMGHKTGSVQLLGFHAEGDNGGGVFFWDATQDKANHDGGTIIDPDNTANLALWDTAAQTTWFTAGTGTGCWVREKVGYISVAMFGGASENDALDDTQPFQKACNQGAVLVSKEESYLISDTVTFNYLDVKGLVKTTATGVLGTPILQGTSKTLPASITGTVPPTLTGTGRIEGVSTAFSAVYSNVDGCLIEQVNIKGFNEESLSVSSFAVNVTEADDAKVLNTNIQNCGGFGIYTQGCENAEIKGNTLKFIGYAGINSSSGLNNNVSFNKVAWCGYFGVKGGYGYQSVLTADVAPSTTQFSIAPSPAVKVGSALTIVFATTANIELVVKTIDDFGTYYTITAVEPMAATPATGAIYEVVDTGTTFVNNDVSFITDNGFDLNVIKDYTLINNKVRFTGVSYLGVTALGAGIWIGADPQGANQGFTSNGITIADNDIHSTYGAGIQLYAIGEGVSIIDNDVNNWSTGGATSYGAIEVNTLSYAPCASISVHGNKGVNVVNTSAKGIAVSYLSKSEVNKNTFRCAAPLVITDPLFGVDAKDNTLTSIVSGANIIEIAGTQPSLAMGHILDNSLYSIGTNVTAVNVTSANVNSIIEMSNQIAFDSVATSTEFATASTGIEWGQLVSSKPVNIKETVSKVGDTSVSSGVFDVAAGASIDLMEFIADSGTIGAGWIRGVARSGTAAVETFECQFYGFVPSAHGTIFASLGSPNGTAFLAAGDFTTVANGNNLLGRYTNNELNTVYLSISIDVCSRY